MNGQIPAQYPFNQQPQPQQPQPAAPQAGGAMPVGMPNPGQAQPQQPQQPQQPPQARSVFTIQTPRGESTVDDVYVLQKAGQMGMPAVGVSADGTSLTLQDGSLVPIPQVLSQLGAQVKGFKPMSADYSQVQPQMRAAMQGLPDDFRKKQYLEHYMTSLGLEKPMIEGSGDDWFVYDPNGGRWMAATNAPGMDMTDAAGYGITGAKMIGSLAGGAIGAGAGMGPGSVVGAAAGAAAGGAGVDALTRAALTMADPSYAAIRGQMGEGEVLADIGKGAAIDAAGSLIPAAGGALLRGTLSPVSRMAAGAGGVAKNAGNVIGAVGQAADTGLGRDITAAMIPGAAEAQLAGLGAQLPAMVMRGGVRAAGAVGDSNIGRKVLGEEAAANLAKFSRGVMQEGYEQPTTRQMAANIGASLGRSRGRGLPEPSADDLAPFLADAKVYRGSLLDLGTEEQLAKELWRDQMAAQMGGTGRTWGSRIGSGIETVENLGKSAESLARGMAYPITKGMRYGGAGLQQGGAAAQRLGQMGRGRGIYSLEDQLYGRLGAEEALGGLGHASINRERYRRPGSSTYLAGGS